MDWLGGHLAIPTQCHVSCLRPNKHVEGLPMSLLSSYEEHVACFVSLLRVYVE